MTAMPPLAARLAPVLERVERYKAEARDFYFRVLLSQYQCPECGSGLALVQSGRCRCAQGHELDPTVAFQVSPCCGVELVLRACHYACSSCRRVVPSRFLFDERVFDAAYFREMMRDHRDRAMERQEAVRRLLAESRSDHWALVEESDMEDVPGLAAALDSLIEDPDLTQGVDPQVDWGSARFDLAAYRDHLLAHLGWSPVSFDRLEPLIQDFRRDRVWRFVALVYLDQDREVELSQQGEEVLVTRVGP